MLTKSKITITERLNIKHVSCVKGQCHRMSQNYTNYLPFAVLAYYPRSSIFSAFKMDWIQNWPDISQICHSEGPPFRKYRLGNHTTPLL